MRTTRPENDTNPNWKPTVCVDLDGVLAARTPEKFDIDVFGPPIPGSQELTWGLSEHYNVLIHTCRCSASHGEPMHALKARVCGWLDDNGYYYNDVWTGEGKPVAITYIDDHAIRCNPESWGAREYEYILAKLDCTTALASFIESRPS